ncbi:MAG TPA: HAD hydrolase-like protein, partial [Planctomycetota bacterium]|nr:HAD hydrolase-like protein [Planctomycetota bacterium]
MPRLLRLDDPGVAAYAALLFDCDGTLVDTMGLHYEAWCGVVAPAGLTFPRERYLAMAGAPTREILEALAGEQRVALNVDALLPEKEERFLALLHRVRPIEPVIATARAYRGSKRMAVVS